MRSFCLESITEFDMIELPRKELFLFPISGLLRKFPKWTAYVIVIHHITVPIIPLNSTMH